MRHCGVCGKRGHDRRHCTVRVVKQLSAVDCSLVINVPQEGGPCLGVVGSKRPTYFEMLIKKPYSNGNDGGRRVAGVLHDNMNSERRPLFELLASENKLSKVEQERWRALVVFTDWAIEAGWV